MKPLGYKNDNDNNKTINNNLTTVSKESYWK